MEKQTEIENDDTMQDTEPAVRTALDAELATEIRRRVLDEPGFMTLTQVVRYGGQVHRASLRPVGIKGVRFLQFETIEKNHAVVHNLENAEAAAKLDKLLAKSGARELHLVTATGDLHVRITRKGKALVSRSKPMAREVVEAPEHDHVKSQPLTQFDSAPFLRAVDIMDVDGRIKASMRGKYDQINEFLKLLDGVVAGHEAGTPMVVVDCGCGKSYLTFAAYFYLTYKHGLSVQVRGIEHNADLVASASKKAADLGVVQDVRFVQAELESCELDVRPEVVLSLHACDTATDEALARAVEWGSRAILCSPCCQHDLQRSGMTGGGPMSAVMRHGILRERLADILTDTFRAQILRILGFRVNIVEFVSAEATARNILLRAEYAIKPGQAQAVTEYLELRDFWKVTPHLETRLREKLERHLAARS